MGDTTCTDKPLKRDPIPLKQSAIFENKSSKAETGIITVPFDPSVSAK
jgi:hypothetical protein